MLIKCDTINLEVIIMVQRNQTIDLFKFVFSIFIIGIHAQIFKNTLPVAYYTITMGLFRIAVPFFFAVSGYYFYQRIQTNRSVKSYFFNLIKIFIVFELIEIVVFSPFFLSYYKNIFFYIWKVLSTGLGGAYWYLTSLILSLIIMMPLWKKEKIIPCFVVGLILYLFCMTNDSYSQLFLNTTIQKLAIIHTQIWTWPQAGLCSSIFYLSMGAIINKYQIKGKYVFSILIITLFCLFFESYLLQSHQAYDGNCYLSLMILTPELLIFCLSHPTIKLKTKRLGEMSLYIYMMHQLILNSLQFILPLPKEVVFIIVVFLCIFISYLITGRKKDGDT